MAVAPIPVHRPLRGSFHPPRYGDVNDVDGMRTVILAGGKGTRLKPFTSVLPKPLMPLDGHAILEVVIRQLARQGFLDITLSVGYLAHLIEAVFGDGADHGVTIRYVHEDEPLGTAGSLRLVDGLYDTFLMQNGDLVTTLDYRGLVRAHRHAGNLLTIATRRRRVEIDYGVVELGEGAGRRRRVTGFREKPGIDIVVSMGIYAIEPEVLEFIPGEGYFDFPDLVWALLKAGAPVGSFGHDGLWLDIGRPDDYDEAVSLIEQGKLPFVEEEFRDPSPVHA